MWEGQGRMPVTALFAARWSMGWTSVLLDRSLVVLYIQLKWQFQLDKTGQHPAQKHKNKSTSNSHSAQRAAPPVSQWSETGTWEER